MGKLPSSSSVKLFLPTTVFNRGYFTVHYQPSIFKISVTATRGFRRTDRTSKQALGRPRQPGWLTSMRVEMGKWFDEHRMEKKKTELEKKGKTSSVSAIVSELPPELQTLFESKATQQPRLLVALKEALEMGQEDCRRNRILTFYNHPLVIGSRALVHILSLFVFLFVGYQLWLSLRYATQIERPNKSKSSLFSFTTKKFDVVVNMETRFDDVKGNSEAKRELHQIVDFLKNPQRYTQVGARLPKGVLLSGPPGVGKTLMAKAVAGEAGVPFISVCGSEFDEVFVGLGSSRIRNLFRKARELAPCVVFIDEMDAVGHIRSNVSSNPYANQTVDQLLSELDGFNSAEGVIVLAATNRPDTLDKALLRPGRFDTNIELLNPFFQERVELFDYYLKKIKCEPGIDTNDLAGMTIGFNGASISNMVNQAALLAAVQKKRKVSKEDLVESLKKVYMGPIRRLQTTKESLLITAYHEAGHALNVIYSPHETSFGIGQVTILPRGASLGHNSFKARKDVHSRTKEDLKAQLRTAMGGRAAEEIILGSENVCTGAQADFKEATELAERMVEEWSMSDKTSYPYFPREIAHVSDKELEVIDLEIKNLLDEAYKNAMQLLCERKKELHLLADALIKYESLDEDDVKTVLSGGKPRIVNPKKNQRNG